LAGKKLEEGARKIRRGENLKKTDPIGEGQLVYQKIIEKLPKMSGASECGSGQGRGRKVRGPRESAKL